MKTFIFIIIFLMMYLIIQHFLGHSQEGLANCSSQEQAVNLPSLAYKISFFLP